MSEIKPEWQQAINEMRDAGFAVIVWTPEEIGDAEPEWVEECSISYGWEHLVKGE